MVKTKTKIQGSGLAADILQQVIQLSYDRFDKSAPEGYELDNALSDGRVKVYSNTFNDDILEVHRGSRGYKDWRDNVKFIISSNIRQSETFKIHKQKHDAVVSKYGAENIVLIGHSRAGQIVEVLNRDSPVKEVISYNKMSSPTFYKTPENQTDIRSEYDIVSLPSIIQRKANKIISIPNKTVDLIQQHSATPLKKLSNQFIGIKETKKNLMKRLMRENKLPLTFINENGHRKNHTIKQMVAFLSKIK